MPRTITQDEMDSRTEMAKAKEQLTAVMAACPELTPLEWCNVLNEIAARMIGHGLVEEWAG